MSSPDFDAKLGAALRDAGIQQAMEGKGALLTLARHLCKRAAIGRLDHTATADDAGRGFLALGLPVNALGPAAGALFKTADWLPTGEFRPSWRVTNHRHHYRVWRYVGQ